MKHVCHVSALINHPLGPYSSEEEVQVFQSGKHEAFATLAAHSPSTPCCNLDVPAIPEHSSHRFFIWQKFTECPPHASHEECFIPLYMLFHLMRMFLPFYHLLPLLSPPHLERLNSGQSPSLGNLPWPHFSSPMTAVLLFQAPKVSPIHWYYCSPCY